MADNPLPVTDLSAVHEIIGGIVSPPTITTEGPEQRKQGQRNQLEPRQFGGQEPSMGPEGTTGEPSAPAPGVGTAPGSGYKPKHRMAALAEDAMTVGSGVA